MNAPKRLRREEMGAKVLAHRSGGKVLSCDQRAGHTGHLRTTHGSGLCICGQCGHGFFSLTAFDRHQSVAIDGGTICWEPESISMARNKNGWWVTELRDMATTSSHGSSD